EKLSASNDIPGLAVAVVAEGAVVHETYRGLADVAAKRPMTSTTPFVLATHTHALTAVAVLRLEEEQRLSLADPVSKHLPWFWVTYGGERPTVTLEQLLHQTSGLFGHAPALLPTAPAPIALEATVRSLAGSRLRAPPGREFSPAH